MSNGALNNMNKYNIFLVCVCLCLLYSYAYEGQASCPSGWIRNRNMCYLVIKQSSTWREAVDKCRSLDSNLMYIETEDEADFIASVAKANQQRILLGGTDEFKEGNYIWHATGKPITFARWHPGEPNNGGDGQHCMSTYSNGLWDDSGCDTAQYWSVCKKSIEICSCRPVL